MIAGEIASVGRARARCRKPPTRVIVQGTEARLLYSRLAS